LVPRRSRAPQKRPVRFSALALSAMALFVALIVVALLAANMPTTAHVDTATQQAPASTTVSSPTALAERTLAPTPQPTQVPQAARLQPYTGDPVAPQPPPSRPEPGARYFPDTGHYVSGEFLSYYLDTPRGAELFGLPLTEDFPQQFPDGAIFRVQYFERARMEWHPELPQGKRVQLGVLTPTVLSGRTFDRLPALPTTQTRLYFPETGHTLSSGFLNYWKANGGLATFGYPLSEEMGEDGVTVQYFERARFEYHSKLEGTPYAVQLSPMGYMALKAARFNVPMGTMVRFNPPRVAEGHTTIIEVATSYGVTVTGSYQGNNLYFTHDAQRGVAWALLGAVPFGDTGPRPVTINLQSGDGASNTVTRTLEITKYPFPSEVLRFDPETAALLDPALTTREREVLATIFGGRTPEQYWVSPFSMPLDGKIRITSVFATRRCYDCPDGSHPTTYHGGLDMGASLGTPVRAPAAGKVVLAEKLAVRGNVIIIDHGLGVYSLFAHNSKLIATVGQMVQKGEIVSQVGSTGLSTGPHLHWELHVSGPPVDPLEWVNRSIP
jgi:murein DD-endopeptidase MepM/ murein hydrolase activator NlpD